MLSSLPFFREKKDENLGWMSDRRIGQNFKTKLYTNRGNNEKIQ